MKSVWTLLESACAAPEVSRRTLLLGALSAVGLTACGQSAPRDSSVAFLQKLPRLTPEQHQIVTARSGGMDHDDMEKGASNGSIPTADVHADTGGMTGMTHETETPPVRAATDAVAAFTTALKSGEAAGAAAWLAPDVVIYEGGEVERSRAEYQAHHLAADIAFLKTAQVDLFKRSGGESGDAAWVNSETRIRGKSSKGRDIDVLSTETALLRKTPEGWRITHLHWSSANYKGGAS